MHTYIHIHIHIQNAYIQISHVRTCPYTPPNTHKHTCIQTDPMYRPSTKLA